MKRKFLSNLVYLLFINILIKVFYVFGIDIEVQNHLGTHDYGQYFALLNFSMVLQIILDLGIHNYNNKEIAQHKQLLGKYFSALFPLKVLLGFIYAITCILVGIILNYNHEQFRLIFILIFNQFLASFILYLRTNISALHYFKLDGLFSILDKLLMILFIGAFLVLPALRPHLNIRIFILSQTLAFTINFILVFGFTIRYAGFFKPSFNLKYYWHFIKKTYPYALLIFLMQFYFRSDSVLLERLLEGGSHESGIYAQSFRIVDGINNFAYIYAVLLLPIFSRILKAKQPVEKFVKLGFTTLIVPLLILFISSCFYANQIIELLYDHHSSYSASIFILLSISITGYAFNYVFGTLLTANGSLRVLNIISVIAVIVNLSLNLVLIPLFYAKGAAVVSAITQWIAALAQVVICKKLFAFRFNYLLILKVILLISLIIFVGILLKKTDFTWYLEYFLIISCAVFVTFAIRILHLKDFVEIVKLKQ